MEPEDYGAYMEVFVEHHDGWRFVLTQPDEGMVGIHSEAFNIATKKWEKESPEHPPFSFPLSMVPVLSKWLIKIYEEGK